MRPVQGGAGSHSIRQHGPLEPRLDRPLPLWMIFPLLFAGVYLSHLTLLRLPYYWDEAGYYIPAAYDFFRTGSLIPTTTLSNAHPPLPSLYLALWWKASGFTPAVTRTAVCIVSAIALLGVYELSLELNGRTQVAAATTGLTAIYPIWFAQSTLAHADIFAAAGTLWGLAFAFRSLHALAAGQGRASPSWAAAACFSLAAISKETSIVTPLALAFWAVWLARAATGELRRARLRFTAAMLSPLLPLLAWYTYHRLQTGYIFGNPQFLLYNATATLNPVRALLALARRVLQLTAHMNMFVPVLCSLAALFLVPVPERDGHPRPRICLADQSVLYVTLLANAIFFSVFGGAVLARYLLPMYPLILLLCTSTLHRRVRYWWGLVGLSAIAFLIGLLVNPPYQFAPEDNLSYAHLIRLHQQAIRQIQARFPGSAVLTAWPATDELTRPELGYVRKPVPVVRIDNFSLPALQTAAATPKDYRACLAFSTKYDPPYLPLSIASRNESLDTRYFNFHRDLDPAAIARLLDGTIVWRGERSGEWAAVLSFRRTRAATIGAPPAGKSAP